MNQFVLNQFCKFSYNSGLIIKAHGEVRVFPFPPDPEAFELLRLNADIFLRVFAAEVSDFQRRKLFFLRRDAVPTQLFGGGQFDG